MVTSTNYFRGWLLMPFVLVGPGALSFHTGDDSLPAQVAYLAWHFGVPPSIPVLALLAWRSFRVPPAAFRRDISLAPLALVPIALAYLTLKWSFEMRQAQVHDSYLHSLVDVAVHALVIGYAMVAAAFAVYLAGRTLGAIDPHR